MDQIDDERIAFYLKHREEIDAWLGLKKDASTVLDEFLRESVPEISQLAPQLGDEVISRSTLAGRTPRVTLLRKTWRVGQQIRAGVHLAWPATRVLWAPASDLGGEPAYVSVWANRDADGGVGLAKKLRSSLSARAKKIGLRVGSSTSWNPVWKYMVPEESKYWEDLTSFRQHIIDQMEWFWREFSDDIDSAL